MKIHVRIENNGRVTEYEFDSEVEIFPFPPIQHYNLKPKFEDPDKEEIERERR